MRLNHNMNSLLLYNVYSKNLKSNDSAISKISSGLKINSAKDNPNKIAPAETIRIKLKSLEKAQQNAEDSASMIQTADGAMNEVNNMLARMKELTVSAADGTKSDSEKNILQNELDELLQGINDIANNTEFNGIKIVGYEGVNNNTVPYYKDSAIGAEVGDVTRIPMFNINAKNLVDSDGNTLADIDVTTSEGAETALNVINESIKTVGNIRAKLGAIQNSLESTVERNSSLSEKYEAAHSILADADVATEIAEVSRTEILYQTQIALIAQSNNLPQDALKILSNN